MINFNFTIINPWAKEKFANLFCRAGMLTQNKAWELEVCSGIAELVSAECIFNIRRRDHAGFSITLALLGISITAQIYDTRHWDHKNDCWEIYKE